MQNILIYFINPTRVNNLMCEFNYNLRGFETIFTYVFNRNSISGYQSNMVLVMI